MRIRILPTVQISCAPGKETGVVQSMESSEGVGLE